MIKNYKLKIKNSARGQVAIIVLLVSAVMLTLGLSMSKTETIEVKINTNDELLKKAFDTAESGINYYLGTGETKYASPDKDSVANISAIKISDGSDQINFGEFVPAGNSENYWLVNHLADGSMGLSYYLSSTVDVCGVGFTGALKVDYFSKIGVNFRLKRSGYNFGNVNKVTGFVDVIGNCVTVDTPNNPVLISVTPIFDGGKFYLEAHNGATFSSQGLDITSLGSSGGTNKKLSIRQRYKIPGFMLSGMMAEGSILSD